MSKFLAPSVHGHVAIALCARCNFRLPYDKLVQDPDTKLWVCRKCQDDPDPWRLPARRTEDISLQHPRPDVEIDA